MLLHIPSPRIRRRDKSTRPFSTLLTHNFLCGAASLTDRGISLQILSIIFGVIFEKKKKDPE